MNISCNKNEKLVLQMTSLPKSLSEFLQLQNVNKILSTPMVCFENQMQQNRQLLTHTS